MDRKRNECQYAVLKECRGSYFLFSIIIAIFKFVLLLLQNRKLTCEDRYASHTSSYEGVHQAISLLDNSSTWSPLPDTLEELILDSLEETASRLEGSRGVERMGRSQGNKRKQAKKPLAAIKSATAAASPNKKHTLSRSISSPGEIAARNNARPSAKKSVSSPKSDTKISERVKRVKVDDEPHVGAHVMTRRSAAVAHRGVLRHHDDCDDEPTAAPAPGHSPHVVRARPVLDIVLPREKAEILGNTAAERETWIRVSDVHRLPVWCLESTGVYAYIVHYSGSRSSRQAHLTQIFDSRFMCCSCIRFSPLEEVLEPTWK